MRNARKFDNTRDTQRHQPRPSRRRTGTRAGIIRAELKEA